jgi:hypothetical protein
MSPLFEKQNSSKENRSAGTEVADFIEAETRKLSLEPEWSADGDSIATEIVRVYSWVDRSLRRRRLVAGLISIAASVGLGLGGCALCWVVGNGALESGSSAWHEGLGLVGLVAGPFVAFLIFSTALYFPARMKSRLAEHVRGAIREFTSHSEAVVDQAEKCIAAVLRRTSQLHGASSSLGNSGVIAELQKLRALQDELRRRRYDPDESGVLYVQMGTSAGDLALATVDRAYYATQIGLRTCYRVTLQAVREVLAEPHLSPEQHSEIQDRCIEAIRLNHRAQFCDEHSVL